ncbi:MAG: polymorphic toxin-type HINT domain-containing protein [Ruminococcus bicirculans (ex Wegman et al. 2014)]|uniref:polymorphic toxin-type HINT domain-containing protein n=1 Tax=Ruminococcus bicirculans (ex Wegman et al. 2014) TaxID=1160721 RepID=UPI00283CE80B|nr:HINT domain-containing protein [Hominimerdicola aceti]
MKNSFFEGCLEKVNTLIHLTVNGEEIITTVDHPFYVNDRGFVNAGELTLSDKLLDTHGSHLSIEKK